MALDKTKPYVEAIGHPFIKFRQDDKDFNAMGEEIDADGMVVGAGEGAAAPAPAGDGDNGTVEPGATNVSEPVTVAPAQPGPDTTEVTVEPRMEHKGGGYYKVFNEKGEMVEESLPKAEAEAKVEELKQVQAALQDG